MKGLHMLNEIIDLRRDWLNAYDSPTQRHAIAKCIHEIEYQAFTQEERERITVYKNQAKAFAMDYIIRQGDVKLKDYITVEKPPFLHKKILFGIGDMAGYALNLCDGMIEIGAEAYLLEYADYRVHYRFNFGSHRSDLRRRSHKPYIEVKKMLEFTAELIVEFDIFNFLNHPTLLPDNLDLPLYNELEKKVVFHYIGAQGRIFSHLSKKHPYWSHFLRTQSAEWLVHTDKRNFEKMMIRSMHSPAAFSSTNEYRDILSFAFKHYFEHLQPLNLDKYDLPEAQENPKYTIALTSTGGKVKGTEFAIQAVERLKKRYDIDFILVKGKTHEEAKAIFKQADLLLDQFVIGYHGMFCIEAMALGKPVVCFLSADMVSFLPDDCPIINANPDNLEAVIEYCINNQEETKQRGEQGKAYAKANHDHRKIVKQMLGEYDKIKIIKADENLLITQKNKAGLDKDYILKQLLKEWVEKCQVRTFLYLSRILTKRKKS